MPTVPSPSRSLRFAPLNLSNLKVTVATNDRVMHIYPLQAQVNGGEYSGDITLDRRTLTPVISMDEHLSGIDVGPTRGRRFEDLARDRPRRRESQSHRPRRRSGRHLEDLERTLRRQHCQRRSGRDRLGLSSSVVAEALLRRGGTRPRAPNSRRTQFTAFKLSADIANGVAQTHDLLISSAVLKVTGQGSANLPTKTLDFSLLADTLQVAGNTPIQIPVKVTGPFADPTVRPDLEALAKSEVKQKLQNVLQDKLKGLFGKP